MIKSLILRLIFSAFFGAGLNLSPGAALADMQNLSLQGREFSLYVPQGLSGPAPLVVVLHGALSSAEKFSKTLNLRGEADARGFVLAYLNGTIVGRERGNRRSWNSGGGCCASAGEAGVDDLDFIASVISSLVAQGYANGNKVYLVGHSNGAMMSYRFACERSGMVAGVVGLSGVITANGCSNASGVRVLVVQGAQDPIVPVAGGGNKRISGMSFRTLQSTVDLLSGAGASVEVVVLDGAEHSVADLDSAARNEIGTSVTGLVGQFVR